ncbi:protein YgfX [Photobacterium jeanii]|uniref:protein YgfX n=1 Tax=Photobacterium jeanii TaxID=858640 RepID=UPI000AEA26AF
MHLGYALVAIFVCWVQCQWFAQFPLLSLLSIVVVFEWLHTEWLRLVGRCYRMSGTVTVTESGDFNWQTPAHVNSINKGKLRAVQLITSQVIVLRVTSKGDANSQHWVISRDMCSDADFRTLSFYTRYYLL